MLIDQEIIDAIRKNGYEQISGSYFELKDGTLDKNGNNLPNKEDVIGACAIGQAALNLGVTPAFIRENWTYHWKVTDLNDGGKLTLDQIAQEVEREIAHLEAISNKMDKGEYPF